MNSLNFPDWQLGDAAPAPLLQAQGFVRLSAQALSRLVGRPIAELDALAMYWNDLPADEHLRDGGRYRYRRHASLRVIDEAVQPAPPRPHWQPVDYNALHGGIERWFSPCESAFLRSPALQALLRALACCFAEASGRSMSYVELHQFRIDTRDGIGRPTPEGAHRDGVDFVAVLLVDRQAVRGGETRVFQADGPAGLRFTMEQPWTTLLLDDARVIHETTPLQPEADYGYRDTLVLTFRHDGFLDPPTA